MGVISRWKASITEAYTTGDTKWVRISIITTFAQCIALSILEIVLIILHEQELSTLKATTQRSSANPTRQINAAIKNADAIVVYFALYIAAQLFQVYLCLNATYNKNTIQVIALAVFNFCLFGYSIVQVFQREKSISAIVDLLPDSTIAETSKLSLPKTFGYVVISLAAVFALALIFQAYRLYQVYGWSVYKKIGADMRMRRIYRSYQIFIVFLKVDVFFFVGFSVQYIVLVIIPSESIVDLVIHVIVSLCISIVLLSVAFISVRREHRVGMVVFLLGLLGLFIYFIIKLYQIHNPSSFLYNCEPVCPNYDLSCRSNCIDKFGSSRIVLSMFLVLDILLDIVTGAVAYMTLKNFGNGLKFHLTKQPSSIGMVNLDGQDPNKRWSII
ncbi:hypothetical protein H4R33_000141 [Dimargaris cristalligena]|nr:hypothetical protein H4R33_000141 [Dimargaris cristalligena]